MTPGPHHAHTIKFPPHSLLFLRSVLFSSPLITSSPCLYLPLPFLLIYSLIMLLFNLFYPFLLILSLSTSPILAVPLLSLLHFPSFTPIFSLQPPSPPSSPQDSIHKATFILIPYVAFLFAIIVLMPFLPSLNPSLLLSLHALNTALLLILYPY